MQTAADQIDQAIFLTADYTDFHRLVLQLSALIKLETLIKLKKGYFEPQITRKKIVK
jgi:hypothetical protein